MNQTLYNALALIVPLIVAIVFHEVSHGYVASLLGDPTAKERRRLSLNPLRHVDPVGTVILPGLLALVKAPVFGWAKPVPVIKARLRNPRYGMMAVAAAGPASNLVLAAVGAVLLGLLVRGVGDAQPGEPLRFIALNLSNFLSINIFLALFNLLPIPPFDGSHIVEGLLPPRAAFTIPVDLGADRLANVIAVGQSARAFRNHVRRERGVLHSRALLHRGT